MTQIARMSMNRVIHAAVRRDLARLDAALGDFPDGDEERARDLERAYAYLRSELTRHHEHEDALIWPMLAQFDVDAALLATMESEHHAMADALREVADALDRLVETPTVPVARDARNVVAAAREVIAQHLAHEERAVEPFIHDVQDTPEWKAVEKKLRKAPPVVTGEFFAWLQDGMDECGRSYLRTTVPAPVMFVFARGLGRGYRREVAAVWHR
jgi:hemerythrin-like domain-containing protein